MGFIMKLFLFFVFCLISFSISSGQEVRPDRKNVFDSNANSTEPPATPANRLLVVDDKDDADISDSEEIVKNIIESISYAVQESNINQYLDCFSKEKKEKDRVKIAKCFMMEDNLSLDVIKTFVLNESEDQIEFMAKYCVNGVSIILSEITLIKEDGEFVVSNEKILENTSNNRSVSLGFPELPERNAHLVGLDPRVPIKPCHMGRNCRFANEAGHKIAEEEFQQKQQKPFEPLKDLNPIVDPPFNQNGNNFFVDQNGNIRENHSNGWVSVPKNGPQFVDLKQLKKFYPDRYSGCKDGNCAGGKCKVR